MDCVKTLEFEDAKCLPQCSGVFITHVEDNSDKTDPASGIDYLKLIKKYEKYEYFKKTVDFSPGRVLSIIRRETTSLSDTTDKVGVCQSVREQRLNLSF